MPAREITEQRRCEHLQGSLVEAMKQPSFYPKAPEQVVHRETPVSHVFLAGDLVFKIKKPVCCSFLDYSTLARRRHYLLEELRLNRRLAPSVYLAVVPISRDAHRWRLSGESAAAEYTLLMRRLPERRMLPFLLETRQVTPGMMRDLAEIIAAFHRDAEPLSSSERHRQLELVERQWNATLRELQGFVGTLIDNQTYDDLGRFGAESLNGIGGLITRRAEQGWFRDLHGDLRCEHICFAPEGIQIFDCAEFNVQLRRRDVASEVAFAVMDLESRGAGRLAGQLLNRYSELSPIGELPNLLAFYRCYGALSRAAFNLIFSGAGDGEAGRYLRYAERVAWKPLRPFIVLLCGASGSGKSTLALELGARLNLPVVSFDAIWTELLGKRGRGSSPTDDALIAAGLTEKAYDNLTRETEKEILAGSGAILDATFAQRLYREKIAHVAAKYGVPLLRIHCSAPEDVIKLRLEQTSGRWDVYLKEKALCQPLVEVPRADYFSADTAPPPNESVDACERFLRSRLAHR
jgi:aminoglycoside phosphotransferase family enzyme/predicted kinase